MRIIFAALFMILFALPLAGGYALAADAPAQDNKAQPAKAKETEDDIKKMWVYGSLMYDKKTAEWITEAIKSFDQQIPIEILLPGLFPSKEVAEEIKEEAKPEENKIVETLLFEGPKEAPSFYLKSILYFSSDSWSIWLNNRKISDKTNQSTNNITVSKVTGEEVTILWQKTQLDKILPNWKAGLISIGENKYASEDKNIVIDDSTGDVYFVLKPNQSMVSKTLKIVEGPAESVKLSTSAAADTNNPSTQTSPLTTQSMEDTVNGMKKMNEIHYDNVNKLK